MKDERHLIHELDGKPVTVLVRRDRRLVKSARWSREGSGEIVLRVPLHATSSDIKRLLGQVEAKLKRQLRRNGLRTDAELQARAEAINRKYFKGEISWNAIRWVSNMKLRLGSCTTNGPTDGHIRISERIREWPDWVIDYIVAHELAHRKYPHHGPEFWAYLKAAYPLTERARGFIQGVGFAKGETLDEGKE
jgi:predicted metal-dependent hydrolase